ncbi:MAG: response regulator [Phycisphaerales bacterium]|jgi:threonine dehydrogenase-like Zn-dependent dehydrogenase/DNA-binding NarL/FixJ family response regulator
MKIRVFLVDDRRTALREFQTYLELKDCEVIPAYTIDRAMQIIKDDKIRFDVAILDMVFPKQPKGGFRLLREIKRTRPDVQCMIVSAYAKPAISALCITEGAFMYPRKTRLDTIFALVQQAYFLKEGIQYIPRARAVDMWGLGMPAKLNRLTYMRAPLPRYRRNEVVVRTLFLGVCGTDVNSFASGKPSKRAYPIIEFHEAVGEVVAKGADVEDGRFRKGDWVIPMVRRCQKWNREPNSEWDFHIGYCEHWQDCRNRNRPDLCLHRPGYLSRGTGKYHGFGSEYFSDSQEYLIKVTKQQRDNLGYLCILTEPLSVSWKVIREIEARRGITKLRDKVLIAGIGPIGMLCIAILYKMYPGTEICAIDLFDKHHKVSLIKKHFKKRVKYIKVNKDQKWPEDLSQNKFDIIIDATGDIRDVFPKICEVVNPEGMLALLSVSDEFAKSKKLSLRTEIFDKIVTNGVKIIGSVCASKQDMEDSLTFMSEICDMDFLADLVFPENKILPSDAPDSIKRLCNNKKYLKILIST